MHKMNGREMSLSIRLNIKRIYDAFTFHQGPFLNLAQHLDVHLRHHNFDNPQKHSTKLHTKI